jgi:outer membrane protein
VLASRDGLRADEQDVAALQSEADQMRKRFAAGKAAQVEVLRAQAALQRAVADRLSGLADLDGAEHQLAAVTGLPFASIHVARFVAPRLADTVFASDTTGAARAALVGRVLSNNPDAVLAQRRASAAAAVATAARAMALPQLQASGAYLSPGSIDGNFHPDWQIGIQMSYALFTGGAVTSAVHAAEADARAANAGVRLAQLMAEDGVDQSLASLREARARTAALESAEAQAAEVVRIEALARGVGEGTQTDFLTAAADLLRTRVSLIDSRYAELLARIELARLTGELSPVWLARNVESLP